MKVWHYKFAAIAVFLVTQTATSTELISGKWVTDCTPLIKRHSVISSIEFLGKEFVARHQLFADINCKILNLEIESIGEHTKHRNKFHWSLNRLVLKLLRLEVVEHYNEKAICGYPDWKLDEERDIAGRFCEPTQNPALDTVYHDKLSLRSERLKFFYFPEIPDSKTHPGKLFKKPLVYKHVPNGT